MKHRTPPISVLEHEEIQARNRLAVFRAKRYAGNQPLMWSDIRLRELERRWQVAVTNLRRAREGRVG
jgi:hypothetical protein